MSRGHYIYLIEFQKDGEHAMKIGKTEDYKRRISEFRKKGYCGYQYVRTISVREVPAGYQYMDTNGVLKTAETAAESQCHDFFRENRKEINQAQTELFEYMADSKTCSLKQYLSFIYKIGKPVKLH